MLKHKYQKIKDQIIYYNSFNLKHSKQVSALIDYFELSEVEIDILYYVLYDCLNLYVGYFFINDEIIENDIINNIQNITKASKSNLLISLRKDSVLIKEEIIYLTDERVILNNDWEEYFFKDKLRKIRTVLKAKKIRPYQSKANFKPISNEKNINVNPYDLYSEIESVDILYNYKYGKIVHMTFKAPINTISEINIPISPMRKAVENLGLKPLFISESISNLDSNRSRKDLINQSRFRIGIKYDDYLPLMNELGLNYFDCNRRN